MAENLHDHLVRAAPSAQPAPDLEVIVQQASARRRRTATAAVAALVVVVVGATALVRSGSSGDTEIAVGHPDATVAPPSLVHEGTDPRAFWEAVVSLPFYGTAMIIPPPDDVAALTRGSSLVVVGTVTAIDVVSGEWRPAPDLPNTAVRGSVRVELAVSDVLDGEVPDAPIVWEIPAWLGDPAFNEADMSHVRAAIGRGPIGAKAVLFLTSARGESGTYWATSGVLEADGSAVVVAHGQAPPEHSAPDFADAESLERAVRRATG